MPIIWKMPFDIAEKHYYLQQQLDNYEITDQEYVEQVAMLPGYPLTRLLRSGDDLRIQILPRPMSQVNRVIH